MNIRIWSIDPGATVGVACITLATPSGDVTVQESTFLPHLEAVLWWDRLVWTDSKQWYRFERRSIVTENFVGAGPVGADGRLTLRMAGYFNSTGVALHARGWVTESVLVNPDKRMHKVAAATKLITDTGHKPERNAVAAMAHALAYAEMVAP